MAQILGNPISAKFVSKHAGNRGHSLQVRSQSGRQATITLRNKLKTARFSDIQADSILEATETAGPDFVKKNELELLKFEVRTYFIVLVTIVTLASPEGTPVGTFIRRILPNLFKP